VVSSDARELACDNKDEAAALLPVGRPVTGRVFVPDSAVDCTGAPVGRASPIELALDRMLDSMGDATGSVSIPVGKAETAELRLDIIEDT